MPDIIVHTAFGAEVLERTALDVDRDIYDLGLLGPDPYLFYRFYRPPRKEQNMTIRYFRIWRAFCATTRLIQTRTRTLTAKRKIAALCIWR